MTNNVTKKQQTVNKREPKGAKCLPTTQRAEPKNDKNASRNRLPEKVAKRIAKWSSASTLFGSHFGSKNQ